MGGSMRGMGRSAGRSIRNMLGGVFALALLIGYSVYQADFVLDRSLALAFPHWQVTYRGGWPMFAGGATARDVVLIPPQGKDAGTVKFANLRVSVPFFEYYMSAFSHGHGSLLSSIRDLRLEFSDGHGALNESFTPELAAFGNFTGAPFEAEGCMNDTVWLEKEVAGMGLNAHGIDLVLAFNSEGQHLVKEQTLSAPGVGRVDQRRELIKHDDFSLFSLIESTLSDVVADEWHVKDQGFVAARNRYCAFTDKTSEGEFVQRHVRSVSRLLEEVGLAMLPDLDEAYRSYASGGGGFDLSVRYDPPLNTSLDATRELDGILPRMQGKFTVAGKIYPLAFKAIPARPMPESEQPMTTFAVVQRESAQFAAANPYAVQDVPENGRIPAITVTAPKAASPAAPVASAKAPPEETPSLVPDEDADGAVTKYSELAGYIGKYMTIHQLGQPPVQVELLRVVDTGILVRRHMTGGNIEYVLDRSRFAYAKE